MLSPDKYYNVIKETSLISVDILCIYGNKVLLGKRNNEPAKGYLFNPGSRVYKYETQSEAIERVCKNEIGINVNNKKVIFLGNYDHIYNNNFIDDAFGTHYLTHAYIVFLDDDSQDQDQDQTQDQEIKITETITPDNQHQYLRWYNIDESLLNDEVHPYVKWFLKDIKNKGYV